MDERQPLVDLVAEMVAAKVEFQVRKEEESAALNASCAALNRLNAAQRAVDAALTALRGEAPHESDWGREF